MGKKEKHKDRRKRILFTNVFKRHEAFQNILMNDKLRTYAFDNHIFNRSIHFFQSKRK